MNACQLYRDSSHLVLDVSPIELVSNIIKLAYMKIRLAKSKVDVLVLEKVVLNAKKLLINLKNAKITVPYVKLSVLKEYIKSYTALLKYNIGISLRKFIMWIILMLQKSYKNEEIKKKAEEAAKMAAETVLKQSGAKTDSREQIALFRDAMLVKKAAVCLRRMMLAKKILDDKRRISTTKTPTMWEKRYVLGIKPGVSFNEKDWRAYKENGFVVVENKRTGQRYQKSQSELVAAANNERSERMNTADPLIGTPGYEYGAEDPTPQQKNSLRNILKKITSIIVTLTGLVTAIKALKSNASGWSSSLRSFLSSALSWIQTAKQTWSEVNKSV